MNLAAQIQKDIQRITTGDFAVPIIFSVTNGLTVTTVTCKGIAVKHHLVYDPSSGSPVNGKIARVTVSELALRALNYPVRDSNNNVSLIKHMVTWTDVSGLQATYVINEQFPDETTGAIVCLLGDYGVVTPPGRLIIGWIVSPFTVQLTNSPNPTHTQTLANGDVIPLQYALNGNGTLTVPYMATYTLLEPFYMDNAGYQNIAYNKATGTFDGSQFGGFSDVNAITFNASIPIWQS